MSRIEWDLWDKLNKGCVHVDKHLVAMSYDGPVSTVFPLCHKLAKAYGLDEADDYEVHTAATGPVFEVDWLTYKTRDGLLFCHYSSRYKNRRTGRFGKAVLATRALAEHLRV